MRTPLDESATKSRSGCPLFLSGDIGHPRGALTSRGTSGTMIGPATAGPGSTRMPATIRCDDGLSDEDWPGVNEVELLEHPAAKVSAAAATSTRRDRVSRIYCSLRSGAD